jgi:NAD(P)-dependent dehydrogenase (short-subunit alcohol dehydrogenase family)
MFQGMVLLVTGGGSGIGRATAERAAAEGALGVALVGRTHDKLEDAASRIREQYSTDVLVIPADVSLVAGNEQMVEKTVSQFGALDAAFLNAGASMHGTACIAASFVRAGTPKSGLGHQSHRSPHVARVSKREQSSGVTLSATCICACDAQACCERTLWQ